MKVKLTVREVLTYDSELTVILPEGVDEDNLDDILDEAERQCITDFGDLAYYLERRGFKVVNKCTGFPESPDDDELSIEDYEVIEEEEE